MAGTRGTRGTRVTQHPNLALEATLRNLAAADSAAFYTTADANNLPLRAAITRWMYSPAEITGSGAGLVVTFPDPVADMDAIRPQLRGQLGLLDQVPSGALAMAAAPRHPHGSAAQLVRLRLPERAGSDAGLLHKIFVGVNDFHLLGQMTLLAHAAAMASADADNLLLAGHDTAAGIARVTSHRTTAVKAMAACQKKIAARLITAEEAAKFGEAVPRLTAAQPQDANLRDQIAGYVLFADLVREQAVSRNYYTQCLINNIRFFCAVGGRYTSMLASRRSHASAVMALRPDTAGLRDTIAAAVAEIDTYSAVIADAAVDAVIGDLTSTLVELRAELDQRTPALPIALPAGSDATAVAPADASGAMSALVATLGQFSDELTRVFRTAARVAQARTYAGTL